MANPAPNGSAAVMQGDKYERNPVNDCQLGKEFEVNVAIYSVLTLLQNEQRAIAIECKSAPAKFDDVVLRVQNGNDYEYFYRQVKHKDTEKNPEACITWNDLFRTKKNPKDTNPPFGMPWYYEMGFAPGQHELNDIKELGFVTNYNLVNKLGAVGDSNLEDLSKNLLYPTSREVKRYITENDLKNFFEEWSDPTSWRPPSNDQKSYKFKDAAIEAITKGTQAGLVAANKSLDLSVYGAFLKLLVFHVSMPHVNKLKEINQELLKVFLPFHKDLLKDKYFYITEQFAGLFAVTTVAGGNNAAGQKSPVSYQSKWTTLACRRLLFEEIANEWNGKESTDSTANFGLADAVEKTKKPWNILTIEMLDKKEKWNDRTPMKVVNIFNACSYPVVITCKVLNTLQSVSLQNKVLTKQVTDKKSFLDTIEYFEQLDKEVSDFSELVCESFFCVIAISPSYECSERNDDLVQRLINMQNLRKWIRFVMITQQPIIYDDKRSMDFERIEDIILNWQDLSKDYKTVLFEKTLHLNDNKETSLRALGFEKDSIGGLLNPRALSDLIVHDKDNPLNLGLPKRDMDLDKDYIEREIQLPLVKNAPADKQNETLFTCKEGEFNADKSYQHLLSPVDSKRHPNAHLWVKAKNNRSILELKDFIVRSKDSDCTRNEIELLKDNANFGTGSTDNKLLVIVDLPGKGKSSLMTSLSNKFIDNWSNHSSRLLLRINLHEIKQWEKSHSGVQFVLTHSKVSGNNPKSEHLCLTETIVKQKCSNEPPSVFVLLDGYDEISNEQREITCKAVNDLLKADGIKRIILTCRPEATLESELEKRFSQFSLHLNSFDRDTQTRYLIKRWTSQMGKNGYAIGSYVTKIQEFAEKLIEFAGPALEHENKTFLDIPLQCWIFSECFFQQLLNYIESNKKKPKFEEESFAILNLYDGFYEAKINVLFQEKANMPTSGNEALAYLKSELKESILKSMMRISIIYMMEIEDAKLIGRFCWDAYRRGNNLKRDSSNYARDQKRAMKLGVLQGQQEDDGSLLDTKPQEIRFLHRTFAEYFFARYLFGNFIQEKSKLLDGTFMTKETVTDKTFELISERILKYAEYAGVRRFLDRMLIKHIPPIGEQCPFAKEDRSDALKQWPVIGHKKFNEHLAKSFLPKNSTDYSKLSISKNSSASSELSDEDYKRLRNQVDKKIGLSGITIRNGFEKEPCITSMLVHCIKEYASREVTSNIEREMLAHSVTLSALSRALALKDNQSNEFDKITSCLLHWLDHTLESPNKQSPTINAVFSKWVFVFLNFLIREAEANHQRSSLIVPTCKLLEYHKTAQDFDKTIQAIAQSRLFAMTAKRQNNKIYGEKFFELNQLSSYAIEFWFRPREIRVSDKLFEGILVSLSNRNVLSRPLLNAMADSLANKIAQHIKQADCPKFDDFRDALKKSKDDRDVVKSFKVFSGSHKKLMLENALRPYAFMETIKLFMKKLPEGVTIELSNASLKYITFFQRLMFRMNHHTDLYLMRCNDGESNYFKFESISIILWYFLVADVIVSHLPPADVSRVSQQIFFSEIGHKSLMAYAHATCCCQCKNLNYAGFGIHFPRDDKIDSDSIVEPFRRLFVDKLKLLWKEKGEIGFIDFLLKTENFVGKDEPKSREVTTTVFGSVRNFIPWSSQAQLPQRTQQTKRNFLEKAGGHIQTVQRMVMTSNRLEQSPSVWNFFTGGNQKTRQTKEINWLENAEANLRAIQIAKVPCLLFSDIVAEYIPGKLSQAGLNHLAKALKMLPLFHCEGSCFEAKGNVSMEISDGKLSLFECIMDDDASSPRMVGCKGRSAQIKALQEKLQGATVAQ